MDASEVYVEIGDRELGNGAKVNARI